MARPTKLTPDVREKLLTAIRAGNYRRPACKFAGITDRVLRMWLERGEKQPGSVYGAFARELHAAEEMAEIRAVGFIAAAARNDWKAAGWYLERKFPKRWGRRDARALTVSGVGGGPVALDAKVDLSKLGDSELATLVTLLEKAKAAPDAGEPQ